MNSFQDLEQYSTTLKSRPQSRKNPFVWLIPFIVLLSLYHIFINYESFATMHQLRDINHEVVLENPERFSIPEKFQEFLFPEKQLVYDAKKGRHVYKQPEPPTAEEYDRALKDYLTFTKFNIGFYLALLVIGFGLWWKDLIAILATAAFLMITSVFGLLNGAMPWTDFAIFVCLMYLVLVGEKK